MDVFVFPITIPKMICKDWLEELYPKAGAKKALEILEMSVRSPLCMILGLYDQKTKVLKGFLWGEGNELDNSFFVNSIYISKQYRKNPKCIGTLFDYIVAHYKEWGYDSIFFMTKKPSFFLKRHCKQFEEVCVVYQDL